MIKTVQSIQVTEVAQILGAEIRGASNLTITGLATLEEAGPTDLSFLANKHYHKHLATTEAGVVLLNANDAASYQRSCLVVPDPYLAYAVISHRFDPKPVAKPGIHPLACVDASATVHPTASIGAFAVIEAGVEIGADVTIGPHCVVGEHSVIGEGGWLAPRVTLYHQVKIGKRVVIQSGAVIGGEGFGFAPDENKCWSKIAQIGGVTIGDDCEIGVNTAIDRGAMADTTLGNGVKLDNQIQIAHNVQIGDHTAMAACVGISGSTKIGKHCMLAGGVGLVGHIDICDGVFITGMTMVTHSITEPGNYSSGTAMQKKEDWLKSAVRIKQLDDMARRLKAVEKLVR